MQSVICVYTVFPFLYSCSVDLDPKFWVYLFILMYFLVSAYTVIAKPIFPLTFMAKSL